MLITSSIENHALVIHMPEEFNFQHQSDFRQIYETKIDASIREIYVDFRQTKYMDSASLGMLLILREYVDVNTSVPLSRIELINCSKNLLEILNVTNFGQLFTMKELA